MVHKSRLFVGVLDGDDTNQRGMVDWSRSEHAHSRSRPRQNMIRSNAYVCGVDKRTYI
jgi:hypothetical protein